ncbi:MAG: radical SAM protein [Bacteroidales bacterium]|nr:radical SAM protein [Bacteroidales bacterium]
MKKHISIPIFLPQYGCVNNCVFCNQKTITGKKGNPSINEAKKTIETWLSSIDKSQTYVEIAFFGGNFLGLPESKQFEYLSLAQNYIDQGIVDSIRFSTRPDTISESSLSNLSPFSVKNIEIGVQSMNDEVLNLAGRGHTAKDSIKAAKLINKMGYQLGMQMMVGLPGDDDEKSLQTAQKIVECKTVQTRIYPVLVLKNTELADLFIAKKYNPLSIEAAIDRCIPIVEIFNQNKIKILKLGLHPSESFTSDKELLAGPYHPSFYQLVLSKIWRNKILQNFDQQNFNHLKIAVHSKNINYAIGYNSENRNYIKSLCNSLTFESNDEIPIDKVRLRY